MVKEDFRFENDQHVFPVDFGSVTSTVLPLRMRAMIGTPLFAAPVAHTGDAGTRCFVGFFQALFER